MWTEPKLVHVSPGEVSPKLTLDSLLAGWSQSPQETQTRSRGHHSEMPVVLQSKENQNTKYNIKVLLLNSFI